MNSKADELFAMIEDLPIDVKTELVDKILASLHPSQEEIEEAWKKEIEERVQEVKTDKVQFISGEKVFNEIREKYHR